MDSRKSPMHKTQLLAPVTKKTVVRCIVHQWALVAGLNGRSKCMLRTNMLKDSEAVVFSLRTNIVELNSVAEIRLVC